MFTLILCVILFIIYILSCILNNFYFKRITEFNLYTKNEIYFIIYTPLFNAIISIIALNDIFFNRIQYKVLFNEKINF